MLAVSGQLNLKMYGRGFDLFDKRGGLSGFEPVETFIPANQRRMIYAPQSPARTRSRLRCLRCPDAGQSTALRRRVHHSDSGAESVQQPLHARAIRCLRRPGEEECR